jgi:hypothetical protein
VHPLEGVWAKLDRARDHLNVLDVEWDKFLGSEPCPYGFVTARDSESLDYEIRVNVRASPPPILSAIVGDILHDCRSALDHLAWQLVIAAGGKPGRHTWFPICDTLDQWRRDTEYRRRTDDRRGPLYGIPPGSDIWAFIELAQPYNRGPAAEHFSTLRKLSNRDKHRSLLAMGAFPDINNLAELIHRDPEAVLISQEFALKAGQPLEDGAVVARLRFQRRTKANVYVEGDLLLDIAFSDETWNESRPSLNELHIRVAEYVKQAHTFFP